MFNNLLYKDKKRKRFEVILSPFVQKRIKKLPKYVQQTLRTWSTLIEEHGIHNMRRVPGYHDEPLKGQRKGQRSSRLSRDYRVIYEEQNCSLRVIYIFVVEANKHDYR